MAGLSPLDRWQQIVLVILIVSVVSLWYLINVKKASAKDSYIANTSYTLSHATSGELNLLTYNVAGLPELISSARLPRAVSIKSIGWKLDGFDIVNVQEDFNYNNDLYSYNQHPFRTETKGKVPFGDGLSTLSKYPITKLHRVAWNQCSGTDCLTPKGFSWSRIQLANDVFVDVYNVHATSSTSPKAVIARQQNFQQLSAYIQEHSEGMPLIVMGDFNAHYAYVGDVLHDFKQQTGLTDAWVDIFQEGNTPSPSRSFVIPNMLSITNEVESIDKILYRSTDRLQFELLDYAVEDALFAENGHPLSDHLAISSHISWKYIK